MPASQVIQPAQQSQVATKGQQQFSVQPTSVIVVDDQQPGPSRPLTFTMTPMKHFNPPSVASATGEESQHNISGLSSFLGIYSLLMSYQQIDTLQLFSAPYLHQHTASHPTTTPSCCYGCGAGSKAGGGPGFGCVLFCLQIMMKIKI